MPYWLNLSLIMIDEFVLMSLSELASVMNMQSRLDDVPKPDFMSIFACDIGFNYFNYCNFA